MQAIQAVTSSIPQLPCHPTTTFLQGLSGHSNDQIPEVSCHQIDSCLSDDPLSYISDIPCHRAHSVNLSQTSCHPIAINDATFSDIPCHPHTALAHDQPGLDKAERNYSAERTGPQRHLTPDDVVAITEAGSRGGVFVCTLCNKKFGYKNGLIRHIRLTHVGEKPYQCNICQRRFGYKHILMEHQNLHFGNRPYACSLCDKKFAARSNLIQHRLVHKRPFHCQLCNKRFDRDDQLKKHLFAHPQSRLICNICQYGASGQSDLNRHMVERHNPAVLDTRNQLTSQLSLMIKQENPHEEVVPDSTDSHQNNGAEIIPSPELEFKFSPSQYSSASISPASSHQSLELSHCVDSTVCSSTSGEPTLTSSTEQMDCMQGIVIKKEKSEDLLESCSHSSVSSLSPHTPGSRNETPTPQFYSEYSSTPSPVQSYQNCANKSAAVLPGIHEMFGHRTHHRVPPTFTGPHHANDHHRLPPTYTGSVHMNNVPSSQQFRSCNMSVNQGSSVSSSNFNNNGLHMSLPVYSPADVFPAHNNSGSNTVNTTSRPTAQLPPFAHTFRHNAPKLEPSISPCGVLPELEDVLSPYIEQGRLFRCCHCNILFFERGMYFLHASLHGATNPWQCSICLKTCADKNEFTLHFVNQEHQA